MKRLIILLVILSALSCSAQQIGSSTLEVKPLPPLPSIDPSIETYIDQFPGGKALSPLQREWFYWTNYSRNNPKGFWDSVVNPILKEFPTLKGPYSKSLQRDLYASQPLPFVRSNTSLAKVAGQHAQALAKAKAPISHISPSGATFQDRMESIGVQLCAGENISFGPMQPVMMLVLLYIDEGVSDMGHRRTLLTPQFVEMGIGVGEYPENRTLVVQDFACDQSKR